MTIRIRCLVPAAIAFTLFACVPASAQEGATVVVHLTNYAGADAAIDVAKREAERIYDRAGIHLLWWSPDRPDPVPAADFHVWLMLLSHEMAGRMMSADRIPGHVLGRTNRLARRAYVYTHRVAGLRGKGTDVILGRVIAHEIGHVLLPDPGHSIAGIMRAELDLTATWPPRFLNFEVRAMQERLRPDSVALALQCE